MARALRIATWNVLADSYLRREWYPRTTDAELEATGRLARLLDAVEALGADVVCLQEVEVKVFTALAARLEPKGLAGTWAQKGRGRPDGCATFVREGLGAREPEVVRYADAREGEPHSGHVALLCFVSLDGRVLGVANTLVRWDAPEAQVGLRQVRELSTALGGADGWVVCGDFNATLTSPALEVLLSSGFRDPHEAQAFTFNSAAEPRKIDFLLTSDSLHAQAVAPRRIDGLTPLPSSTEPSDHLALVADVRWRAG